MYSFSFEIDFVSNLLSMHFENQENKKSMKTFTLLLLKRSKLTLMFNL